MMWHKTESFKLLTSAQELVEKKLELAELSSSYEQVCHAFLRADPAKNGAALSSLEAFGAPMPASVCISVTAKWTCPQLGQLLG